MKSIALVAIASMILCSCKNSYESAIEKKITKDAMGINLNYKSEKIDVVEEVKVSQSISDWELVTGMGNISNEEKIKQLESLIETMRKNGSDKIDVWQFKLDRFKSLTSKAPDETDYTVVKNTYKINNPVLNNAEQTLTAYFIINSDGEAIAKATEDEFNKDPDLQGGKTKTHKYEVMMIKD